MALEAIQLDRFVFVATDAEAVSARSHAVVLGAGMALDAGLQTVLLITDASTQGIVAAVLEQVHVVLAHPLRIFHALSALADVQLGRGRLTGPGQ